jgi:hypothetical protein
LLGNLSRFLKEFITVGKMALASQLSMLRSTSYDNFLNLSLYEHVNVLPLIFLFASIVILAPLIGYIAGVWFTVLLKCLYNSENWVNFCVFVVSILKHGIFFF